MSPKTLVRATNLIAIVAIILLMYWMFAFILIQGFDLRVFQRSLTELFALSVMGVIALMAAALMLNIMLNLTRIAERGSDTVQIKHFKKIMYLIVAGFPLLAALLFGGHHLTVQKKQQILVQSAISLVSEHSKQAHNLAHYRFDVAYVNKTAEILSIWNQKDSAFRYVRVIVRDEIDGEKVWLAFSSRDEMTPKQAIKKTDYLYAANLPTREYLQATFADNGDNIRFTEKDGSYDLYYPYVENGKVLAVFHFSDYQHYGKLGSY